VRDTLHAAGVRVTLDTREGMKPGAKYYEWEGRGVPVRLEIGPRDLASEQTMLARRTGGKAPVPLAGVVDAVRSALDEIQVGLLEAARARREEHSLRGIGKDELVELMDGSGGFAYTGYCGNEACETAVKERTKATIRALPDAEFQSETAPETCVWCGERAATEAVWAKAY
jgi:prolyl-tRNA synthetase